MSKARQVTREPMSPLAAAARIAALEIDRLWRGTAVKAAAILVAVIVVAAALGCILGEHDSRATFIGTVRHLFPFMGMALALMFAARALADDAEAGTIHYLLLLPTPRWAVVLGKYISSAAIGTALLLAGLVVLYVGVHIAEPSLFGSHLGDLGRSAAAMTAAGLCYSALFLFLGSVVADIPYLLSLLYAAVFELGLGSVSLLKVASVRHHLGVILGAPHEAGLLGTPVVPVWVAAVVLASLTAIGLGATALLVEGSEYRVGRP